MQATFSPHDTSCKMRKAMSSDGRNPKCPLSTTHVLLSVPLSTTYKIRISNLCAQHETTTELRHRDIVTCRRVNAIGTILQVTLVTHGHLLRVRLGTMQGTYIPIVTQNILIIIVLLCRCGPYSSHGPYGGYGTCLRIKNCRKCKSARTYSCNFVPDPLRRILTMPQCHMRANKCSICALQKPCTFLLALR